MIDPLTGNRGVFFIKSGIASRSVSFLTRFIQVPWEKIQFKVRAKRNARNHYAYYSASGNWNGDMHIEARENTLSTGNFYSFEDPEKAIYYLTGPSIGFFSVSGTILRFEVDHSEIKPHSGVLLRATIPFLTLSGLLREEEIESPQNLLWV